MIPYCNLQASHDSFLEDYFKDLKQLFADCDFIGAGSKKVAAFEAEFAEYMGCKHALGVASGTDALLLPLHALGIGPGDEVIMSTFGFIATADVVVRLGGKPVFVDIDPITFNLVPSLVEAAITPATKAIIPVHLFGQTCDMDAIMAIAKERNLLVVEDVAQACGSAACDGRKLGTIGDFGAFSFYPTKNLGAAGDAGMITTNNDSHAAIIRAYRDHGRTADGTFERIGYNSRLDTIQALYMQYKLRDLDEALLDRVENARLYARLLAQVDSRVVPPAVPDDMTNTFNYYTIRVKCATEPGQANLRDSMQAFLKERGVQTAIYYRQCMHVTPALSFVGCPAGSFPVAEKAADEVLSLPNWPGMSKQQIEKIAAAVIEFLENNPSLGVHH